MIPSAETAPSNGHAEEAGAEVHSRLKREVIYDAVAALEASGVRRPDAFARVAEERNTSVSNVSGNYYTERKHRMAALTAGVDPVYAIMAALEAIEDAVANAKLVIASATMQYEQLRADAGKLAEVQAQLRRML